MFEKELEPYNAVLATVDDAAFITVIYGENVEALHGRSIMYSEWQNCCPQRIPMKRTF